MSRKSSGTASTRLPARKPARRQPERKRAKFITRPTHGAEHKRKVSVSLDAHVLEMLERLAGESQTSLSSAMNDALAAHLRDRAMRELIEDGEPLTDEMREAVREELREAGLLS